jgi:hypothetical protein
MYKNKKFKKMTKNAKIVNMTVIEEEKEIDHSVESF